MKEITVFEAIGMLEELASCENRTLQIIFADDSFTFDVIRGYADKRIDSVKVRTYGPYNDPTPEQKVLLIELFAGINDDMVNEWANYAKAFNVHLVLLVEGLSKYEAPNGFEVSYCETPERLTVGQLSQNLKQVVRPESAFVAVEKEYRIDGFVTCNLGGKKIVTLQTGNHGSCLSVKSILEGLSCLSPEALVNFTGVLVPFNFTKFYVFEHQAEDDLCCVKIQAISPEEFIENVLVKQA